MFFLVILAVELRASSWQASVLPLETHLQSWTGHILYLSIWVLTLLISAQQLTLTITADSLSGFDTYQGDESLS
jgi:hypothetical protein